MNRKSIFRILSLIVFVCSFFTVFADNIYAATPNRIKIKSVTGLKNNARRVTTSGLNAYSLDLGTTAPVKNASLSYSTMYSKGKFVYIINDTSIAGSGNSKRSVLIRQFALWLCQGRTPDSSYKNKVTTKYPYYNEASKLCSAASKAGDNFEINPTIKSVTTPGALKTTSDGYYTSVPINVQRKDIKDNKYKITFIGAPAGTAAYTAATGGTKITDYTNVQSFFIKVPNKVIKEEIDFEVKITAKESDYKRAVRYTSNDYSDVLVTDSVKVTPEVTVDAQLFPVTVMVKAQDTDSEEVLKGVNYKLYRNSNCTGEVAGFSDTYTTDEHGEIILYGLVSGTYYAKQLNIPAGYNSIMNSCQAVSTNGKAVVFKNKRNGITIKNQDIDTGEAIAGARYALYSDSSCSNVLSLAGNKTSDYDGYAYYYGMSSGTYYIKEIAAPSGYVVSSSNCVRADANTTVVFKNKRKVKIAIRAVDANTLNTLSGGKYKLFSDSDCSTSVSGFTGEVAADKNGYAYINDVPLGSYYVKEVSAPKGYYVSESSCKKLKSNNEVVFNNKKTSVKVYAVDSNNNYLAGASYQIFTGEGCKNEIKDFGIKSTDSNGLAEFIGLPESDTYSIKEISSAGGYSKSDLECKSVKKNSSVTFSNKLNVISVTVKDSVSNDEISGAVFGLYTDSSCRKPAASAINSQKYEKLTSNSSGTVSFYGMSNDKYYVKEEVPASGYYALSSSDNCKDITANNSISFDNSKLSESDIAVQKIDSYENIGIDDVKIGLFYDSSCSEKLQDASTSKGQAVFHISGMDGNSTYYVKETETPDGYVKSDGECKAVSKGNSVTIKNNPYGNVKVMMIEKGTSLPIKGIKLRLLDRNKNLAKDVNNNAVKEAVTDENGYANFEDVFYGDYFIDEVTSNINYKSFKEPVRIVLNADNDSKNNKSNDSLSTLGDGNGDKKVTNEDLIVYQSYTKNIDGLYNLSIKGKYNLDVNRDGNTKLKELEKDMNSVRYYLTFADKDNEKIYNAARKVNTIKKEFCNAVFDNDCSTDDFSIIKEMDKKIQSVTLDYYDARNKAEIEDNKRNTEADDDYNKRNSEYNKKCSSGSTDPQCVIVPEKEIIPLTDVCLQYAEHMPGDANKDCEVNKEDLVKLEEMIEDKDLKGLTNSDLNNDGVINNKDYDILDHYVTYTTASNKKRLFSIIDKYLDNRKILCAYDSLGCNINEDLLKNAITKVNKKQSITKEVSSSTAALFNEKITLTISKQALNNEREIRGAKISIRDSKDKTVLTYTSERKPKEIELPAGKYSVIEVGAPQNYKPLKSIINIEIGRDGNAKILGANSNMYKIEEGDKLVIYNALDQEKQTIVVPDTASNVTIITVLVGISLILGGGYLLYTNKKENA